MIKITKKNDEFKIDVKIDKAYYEKTNNDRKDMAFRLVGYKSEEKIKITFDDFKKYQSIVSELFGYGSYCFFSRR